ncbi:MAG: hypothetical protein MJE66_20450 [Proteobacteria bacterium]|nr:hypothetical protein [Pseudomonadota bacterium]
MGFEVTFEAEGRVRVVTVTGRIEPDVYRKRTDEVAGQYPDGPLPNTLWDLTRASFGQLATRDVQELVRINREFYRTRAGGRSAFLVSEPADYGVARMVQMLAEELPRSYGVYTDREAAIEWLSEPEPDAGEPEEEP